MVEDVAVVDYGCLTLLDCCFVADGEVTAQVSKVVVDLGEMPYTHCCFAVMYSTVTLHW